MVQAPGWSRSDACDLALQSKLDFSKAPWSDILAIEKMADMLRRRAVAQCMRGGERSRFTRLNREREAQFLVLAQGLFCSCSSREL